MIVLDKYGCSGCFKDLLEERRNKVKKIMQCPHPPSLHRQTTSGMMVCRTSPVRLTSDTFPIDAILKHNERVVESAKQAIRETREIIQRQRYIQMHHDSVSILKPTTTREKVDKSTSCDDVMRVRIPQEENLTLPNITKFFEPMEKHCQPSPGLVHHWRDPAADRQRSPPCQNVNPGTFESLEHGREQVMPPVLSYGNRSKGFYFPPSPSHYIREAGHGDTGHRAFHRQTSLNDEKETDSCSSNGLVSPRLAPQLISPAGSNDANTQKFDAYVKQYDKDFRLQKQLPDDFMSTNEFLRRSPIMKENLGTNVQDRTKAQYEGGDWRRERSPFQRPFAQNQPQANVRHSNINSCSVPPFQRRQNAPIMNLPPPNTYHPLLVYNQDQMLTQNRPNPPLDHATKLDPRPPSPSNEVVLTKDGKKRGYLCQTCGKVYCRKYVLKIHQRVHSGEKPLVCKICGKCFSDPSNMKKHMKLHESDHVTYKCEFCGRHFATWKGMMGHVENVHQKGHIKE